MVFMCRFLYWGWCLTTYIKAVLKKAIAYKYILILLKKLKCECNIKTFKCQSLSYMSPEHGQQCAISALDTSLSQAIKFQKLHNEIWKWISNFNSQLIVDFFFTHNDIWYNHLSMLGFKLIHVSRGGCKRTNRTLWGHVQLYLIHQFMIAT